MSYQLCQAVKCKLIVNILSVQLLIVRGTVWDQLVFASLGTGCFVGC